MTGRDFEMWAEASLTHDRPAGAALARPRRRTPWLRLLAALVPVLALAVALTAGLVHIDHAHGTYGVSIGTDTRYCSLELSHDAHGGGIDAWCQAAG